MVPVTTGQQSCSPKPTRPSPSPQQMPLFVFLLQTIPFPDLLSIKTMTMARVAVIFSLTLSLFVVCHARQFNLGPLHEETSIAVWNPVEKSYPETSLQVLEQSLDRASPTLDAAAPIVRSIAIALPREERTTDAALAEITYSDNINEFSRRPKSVSETERKLYPLEHHLGLQMDKEEPVYAAAKDDQMVGIMKRERDVEVAYKDNDDDDDSDEEEEEEDDDDDSDEEEEEEDDDDDEDEDEEDDDDDEDEDDDDDDDDEEEEEEEEEEERVKKEKSRIKKQSRSLIHKEEKGKKEKGMERLIKPKHKHEDEQEEEREEREASRIMKRAHKYKKRKECWLKKQFRKFAHKKKGKELEVEKENGGFFMRIGRFLSPFFPS